MATGSILYTILILRYWLEYGFLFLLCSILGFQWVLLTAGTPRTTDRTTLCSHFFWSLGLDLGPVSRGSLSNLSRKTKWKVKFFVPYFIYNFLWNVRRRPYWHHFNKRRNRDLQYGNNTVITVYTAHMVQFHWKWNISLHSNADILSYNFVLELQLIFSVLLIKCHRLSEYLFFHFAIRGIRVDKFPGQQYSLYTKHNPRPKNSLISFRLEFGSGPKSISISNYSITQ